MKQPDFAILITAANRCVADRLREAVATAGGEQMRPSFGFVLRAVAAEEPTVTGSPSSSASPSRPPASSPTTWSNWVTSSVSPIRMIVDAPVLASPKLRTGGAEELAANRSRATDGT